MNFDKKDIDASLKEDVMQVIQQYKPPCARASVELSGWKIIVKIEDFTVINFGDLGAMVAEIEEITTTPAMYLTTGERCATLHFHDED